MSVGIEQPRLADEDCDASFQRHERRSALLALLRELKRRLHSQRLLVSRQGAGPILALVGGQRSLPHRFDPGGAHPVFGLSQGFRNVRGLRSQGLGLEKPGLGIGKIAGIQGREALRHPSAKFLRSHARLDALQPLTRRLGLWIQPQGLLEIGQGRGKIPAGGQAVA